MSDFGIQLKLERARTHIDEFRTKAAIISNSYCVIKPEEDQERQMTVKAPVWLSEVLQNYIQPAAKSAGITKRIGWHTFRRSLASILATKGEHVKVVQELLRHANASITMELYQQADADAKRTAQEHVGSLFVVPKAI